VKQILVTGGTGFLGRHLVDLLQPRYNVQLMPRDVLDATAVEKAVQGMDGIFHLAGRVTRDPKATGLYDLHVQGARNVCEAALRARVQRIVVCSSAGTIACSRTPVLHNEESRFVNDAVAAWPYYLSKIYQEKLALSYFRQQGLPIVVVNPSLLLGPGDDRLSSTGDVRLFLNGNVPNVPAGGFNFVDVRDAAFALVRAMETGAPGRRYLIGAYNVTVKDFFQLLEKLSGVRAPRMELPETWSRAGASVLRGLYRAAGSTFPLDDATIAMAYRFWYIDTSRARTELGLNPRPAEETLRDTIQYLRKTCLSPQS
jgi:dihydroflavonol-4-reductase